MQKLIWILGLWLVGTSQAIAIDLKAPESLSYSVYWGLLRVGDAKITYTPNGADYTLRAVVKDSSSLIELDDSWESQGSHTASRAFVPAIYKVKQAENSYRADKVMAFDYNARRVTFTNKLDASDKAEPMVLAEGNAAARDALSTVFAWRHGGVADVQKAGQTEVVNLKKIVVLQREAGVRKTLKLGARKVPVWRVKMTTVKNGKPSKDSWTVYLQDDASLKPLQIVAETKFGTFTATLAE